MMVALDDVLVELLRRGARGKGVSLSQHIWDAVHCLGDGAIVFTASTGTELRVGPEHGATDAVNAARDQCEYALWCLGDPMTRIRFERRDSGDVHEERLMMRRGPRPAEVRAKISATLTGRSHSPAHRAALREAALRRTASARNG